MATPIQSSGLKQVNASNVPFAFNMPGNFTAGSDVIIGVSYYTGVASDISGIDVNGTAAVRDGFRIDNVSPGNISMIELWRATGVAGGGSTVTINGTSRPGGWYISCGAEEWAAFAASPLDQIATNASDGTNTAAPTATTAATSQADDVVYSVWGEWGGVNQAPVTQPSGMITAWIEPSGAGQQGGGAAYKTVSATGAQTTTWATNTSNAWACIAAAYKLAAAAAAPPGEKAISHGGLVQTMCQ
jgi:hypothetical protein